MAFMNKDLRSVKTEKALYAAMFSLLKNHNFKKITIKKLCEEALISRATFYTHFIDKYDLLEYWMTELWSKNFNCGDSYEQIEKTVNAFVYENKAILKNLIYDVDNETLDMFFNFVLSALNSNVEKNLDKDKYLKNTVTSNFYAGGIISYLSWQVKNKFPPDVPLMNRYLYEMLTGLQDR